MARGWPVPSSRAADKIEILHLIPGRARLRFESAKGHPEFAQRVRHHLGPVTHIKQVTVNTRTGSVLLLYDERALGSPAFLDELSEALGKLFPAHFAPGRVRLSLRQLQGEPELARALETRLSPVCGIRRIEIDPASGNCRMDYDSSLVTSPEFLAALSDALHAFLPGVDFKKLLARAGLRPR